MTINIPTWIINNVAWVLIVGISGGVAMYLQKKRSDKTIKSSKAIDDNVLVTLVRDNTRVMQAIESTVSDNKGISLKVSENMERVEKVLSELVFEIKELRNARSGARA